MSTWLTQRAVVLREFLSWRGLSVVALLIFREILRPLFYWHRWHIFETDISKQVPQPYGKDAVAVKFYAEDGATAILQQVAAMGEVGPEEAARRFARGDWIAIGFVNEQPAGYMWISFSNDLELAFDTFWIVQSGEAVRYGSFVLPAFRGRGIHSSLQFGGEFPLARTRRPQGFGSRESAEPSVAKPSPALQAGGRHDRVCRSISGLKIDHPKIVRRSAEIEILVGGESIFRRRAISKLLIRQ